MKYIILLCDGMADEPISALGDKTPMQAAFKPNMDKLAKSAEIGLCKTVAEGLAPGSDVANLSVLGYDPRTCYSGRSPLEAANIGVELLPNDVALRCNLVTLSDDANYCDKTMLDYCADDISTSEADEIIKAVQAEFGNEVFNFHTGVSYRHCLVWHNAELIQGGLTPPHDISSRCVHDYLPSKEWNKPLLDMMERSYNLLKNHPVNIKRIANGHRPANSIWLWGQGKKPNLEPFSEKYGISGTVVSAVDLINGIGVCAKMQVAKLKGATGYIDTNFEEKAAAALDALKSGQDFVFVHVEAPDECGHRGEVDNKVKAIELIDKRLLELLLDGLKQFGEYRLLIMPDHPTPLSTRTHNSNPVPYLLYQSGSDVKNADCIFTEETASKSGIYLSEASMLMKKLLAK